MSMDRVSKTLLCILVLVLGLLVCRPFLNPGAAQSPGAAQKPGATQVRARSYEHVRFLGGFNTSTGAVIMLLDSRNGNIWSYGLTERRVSYVGQLTELGQALTQTQ
jgi:hypothetical protein